MKDEWKFATETNLEKTFQKEGISHEQEGTEALGKALIPGRDKFGLFRENYVLWGAVRGMAGGRCGSEGWERPDSEG